MARRRLRSVAILVRLGYGAITWRHVGRSVVAIPVAVRDVVRATRRRPGSARAFGRTLLALPVAVLASVLTALLGLVAVINVLAYPFRGYLGLPGRTGDIWSSDYHDSWGGPTLAGAWAVHAAIAVLVVIPALALAVRSLLGLQHRLTRGVRMASAASSVRAAEPVPITSAVRTRRTRRAEERSRPRRTLIVPAALVLFVASSLAAHELGIGDNLLWVPRDLAGTVALAITVAPLTGLVVLSRTRRWRRTA